MQIQKQITGLYCAQMLQHFTQDNFGMLKFNFIAYISDITLYDALVISVALIVEI